MNTATGSFRSSRPTTKTKNKTAMSQRFKPGKDKGRTKNKFSSSHRVASRDVTVSCAEPANNDLHKSCKDYHCYLLRSLDPDHPQKTYIGYTSNPHRRIRQHNGELKRGGARRTRLSGRPWTFVLVVHGFPDSTTALQFEWAWQHPNKSKAFRSALGNNALIAGLLHRRRGVSAKLNILRILLCQSDAFRDLPLNLHFLDHSYQQLFLGLLEEEKKVPNDEDCNDLRCSLPHTMTCEVKSLEQMPFWSNRNATKTQNAGQTVGTDNSDQSSSVGSHTSVYGIDTQIVDGREDSNDEDDDSGSVDISTQILQLSLQECSMRGYDSHDVIHLSDTDSKTTCMERYLNNVPKETMSSDCESYSTVILLSSPEMSWALATCNVRKGYRQEVRERLSLSNEITCERSPPVKMSFLFDSSDSDTIDLCSP